MAFQFIPALRALVPVVASATGLGSWLVNRSQDKNWGTDLRISELETALVQQAHTMAQLAEQVQLLAVEVQSRDREIILLKRSAVAAWIALVLGTAAMILGAWAFFR